MKVAALIQGEPRFCAEFDLFLERLSGCDEVDWFFYMWDKSPPTSRMMANDGHIVVAPYWRDLTKETAIAKLQANLPANHKIIRLELADQNQIVRDPVVNNAAPETIQANVWKMWHSQYMVNQLRLQYEAENNFKYDIVIKTRPDVGLSNRLDLSQVFQRLSDYKDLIIMPGNRACGYGVWSCDLFGMGNSDNMTTYCDIYNQALTHNANGIIFHPETMLSHHLTRNNLRYEVGHFNIEFRTLGLWENLESRERFDGRTVQTWVNHIYISDFGRWA